MKIKNLTYLILHACILSYVTSCGKIDKNGELDGMWHLRTVENLSNNTTKNVKNECIYYSIQQNLIIVKRLGKDIYDKNDQQKIGRFTHTNDSLILYNFVVFQNESIISTNEELWYYYLDGKTSKYSIETLNSRKMVLRSKEKELTFKRF